MQKMVKKFPVISLTGPRQSGKTTVLRENFPGYKYFNMERIDHRHLFLADPIGFLNSQGPKLIFDEAQTIPELFSYIQVVSDERGTAGQYILSGSQSFLMNEHISQSLAGRVSVNSLLPFDVSELPKKTTEDYAKLIVTGFYPRIYDRQIMPADFYPSYLQTYVERDVRTLKTVDNLGSFSKFLSLCAGRTGQILNLSSLANDAGIAVNTAKSWLSVLEASYIIYLLQPYHTNFNKRIIKSPKLYFYDTGIACSLLKITHPEVLRVHHLYGYLFENLVISELRKVQLHAGKTPSLYYWRDSNGTEVDCLLEQSNRLTAIEIKAGQTYSTDYVKNLNTFGALSAHAKPVDKYIVYGGAVSTQMGDTCILSWKDFRTV
jgi:predicted AAA+ superfamily ATPase